MKQIILTKDKKIEELQSAITVRDEFIDTLEVRIDKLERESVEDMVIITSDNFKNKSLQDNQNEVIAATGIHPDDFSEDTWRKFNSDGDQVLVKLAYRNVKSKLFREIKGKRRKDIFISEYLTPQNEKIYFAAREMKRTYKNLHSIFTYQGQVHVRNFKNSNPTLIRKCSDLENFSKLPIQAEPNRTPIRFNPNVPPPRILQPSRTPRALSPAL